MNQFQACVKKDISEFLRYHRNILCMLVLIGIGAMVLITSVIFPGLISQLAVKAPDMITDPEAINELMAKLFPQDVKGSLKIFSSDVGVFYTIAVCLICHSILPGEIKNGRWLIPVNAGIEKRTLLTSKCFVYSVGMAFPVFAVYNVYYYAASVLLSPNCRYGTALQNSAVLSLSVAFIDRDRYGCAGCPDIFLLRKTVSHISADIYIYIRGGSDGHYCSCDHYGGCLLRAVFLCASQM